MSSENKPETVQLTALTSVRFFAALHILLFHVYEAHRMSQGQEQGISLPIFDQIPQAMVNWLRHGYFSTSLFFLISGFILAYLYIAPDGTMTKGKRAFWIARATRVYPLHITILLVAFPVVTIVAFTQQRLFDAMASGVLSAALLQAWWPPYALTWNFPTWALAAVAFFYLTFPLLVRLLRPASRFQLTLLLLVLPAISLLPSLVYLAYHPDGGEPLSFWHEFVMRTPLFWIPHFLMGMLLARIFAISRFDLSWQRASKGPVACGDAAFAAVFACSVLDIAIPPFILRHGLLAPFYLVMIYDLAQHRGLLARVLCLPGMRALGDASFAIFMLQLPSIALVVGLTYLLQLPSWAAIVLIVLVTVGIALLSTKYFEKPVSRWLRNKLQAA